MGKGQYFNGISDCSYSITSTDNGSTQVSFFNNYTLGTASPTWELVDVNITYAEFGSTLKKHFGIEKEDDAQSGSVQSYRNHLSTLNSYLASVGKTIDSRIGVELGADFDRALKHYLEIVPVSDRTKRDRRNHLRLIRRLHADLISGTRKKDPVVTSLSAELRAAIAKTGLAPKTLAKNVDVSPSALQRWLKGALPNVRGIPSLHRLESALELPRGHLVGLIEEVPSGTTHALITIPYRERQKKRSREKYILPESALTTEFKAEWRALFEYKTSNCPMLERQPRGRWRCIPSNAAARMSALVKRGNTVSIAGKIAIDRIRAFFGVIFSPAGLQDLYSGEAPQTLAWLAFPPALNLYLEWFTQRSDGVAHNGQKVFCRFVAALLRPTTGYLWQSHQLASRLPVTCRPETPEAWRKMCEQGHKLVSVWIKESTGISRNPVLPISGLLQLEQPLEPILKGIALIEQAAANAPPGGLSEAIFRRDALLLSMLLSNPLRLRTFMCMTWSPDGTGMLRGNAVTGWRICLENHHLKNGTGYANRAYDVSVAEWVRPRLEAYLEEYRPTILKGQESQYLFAGSRSANMWEGMGTQILALTRRYIEGSPGFGAHAFRYLVATAWLKKYPNDFLTVAELLNDKFETVMAHYAHLKRDTSFQRYEELVGGMMKNRL